MTGYDRLMEVVLNAFDSHGNKCMRLHDFYDDWIKPGPVMCDGRTCEECISRFVAGCINQCMVQNEM